MVEIKKLEDVTCIGLLERMFVDFGIKHLDPAKKMEYWAVMSSEESLLNEPILSEDEEGNKIQAVFFVTRKKNCKKLQLFRFTEIFPALHLHEKDEAMMSAIELFMETKKEYIRPVNVVSLGKMSEGGIVYAGAFLYNVPPVEPCIEAELQHEEVPDEND
jgi:hypothetical protein